MRCQRRAVTQPAPSARACDCTRLSSRSFHSRAPATRAPSAQLRSTPAAIMSSRAPPRAPRVLPLQLRQLSAVQPAAAPLLDAALRCAAAAARRSGGPGDRDAALGGVELSSLGVVNCRTRVLKGPEGHHPQSKAWITTNREMGLTPHGAVGAAAAAGTAALAVHGINGGGGREEAASTSTVDARRYEGF